MFDKTTFYYQAVKRLCGNLDIEAALMDCLEYLETVMPVTGMNLHLFAKDLTHVRILADVSKGKQIKMDRIISLPEDARAKVMNDWSKMRNVLIINHPKQYPVIGSLPGLTGKDDTSIMVMSLVMEEEMLGGVTVFSKGKKPYTREQAAFITVLHDPFAIAMSNALKHEEVLILKNMLDDDNRFLSQELLRISGDKIIGSNNGLKNVMEMVNRVAPLDSPVLLLGETGAGKEIIANAVHYSSNRKEGPFIKVNCGAIPDTLIDSELFGHEKGAFTGALSQKRGRFERANQGTILLDEIGDLPPQAQVRLLRVFQEKEIERVGGTETIEVDVRIIASTNRDLETMVDSGSFRQDLWFRLNVFPILIPPLRERKEDIPDLVHHFIERKSEELKIQTYSHITSSALEQLKAHDWPGNVRELENIVERALIQHQGEGKNSPLVFDIFTTRKETLDTIPVSWTNTHLPRLDEINAEYIRHVLNLTKGKVGGTEGAAIILGLHPNTLRGRMKKLGIQPRKL